MPHSSRLLAPARCVYGFFSEVIKSLDFTQGLVYKDDNALNRAGTQNV